MPDITTRADIRKIVEAFYGDIASDAVLGPYFEPVDMEEHVPKLVDFWASIVFQAGTYRGRPFEKHAALDGLQAQHFQQWLQRFESTVDARYTGSNADQMKQRARQIGTVFQSKLGLLHEKDIEERFRDAS